MNAVSSAGNLSAIDAATGKAIWKTYTIADTPKVIATNTAARRSSVLPAAGLDDADD